MPAELDRQRMYRARFGEAARRRKAAIWQVVVERFLQRWVPPDAVVLDVGCGHGEFLNNLRCARRIGVDLNPDSRAALAPGVEFHQGPATSLTFLPEASVDVAFTSNLIEHLPGKAEVETMFREVRRVLKPGGQVIAMGPNIRFLPGEYWDFWDHLTPISDRSLASFLEYLDFQVVDCRPRFLPYTTRSRFPQAPWLVAVYLRLPFLWPLFGRQFFVRARRP